jgi:PAS domain S-box-containing protein
MGPTLPPEDRAQTTSPKEDEIQRLKHQLEDVQNFMESIIQSIGSGIILTQMDDIITYINRAGEKILGYTKHELAGKPFDIFSLREKRSMIHSLLDHSDDLDMRKEGWMKKKDGVEFPVGFTLNNHLNPVGETIGKIVIFRDLTQVYKIQEEILRMDRLISLGKLASGIAHELRNPLAGIKTTAQALSEEMAFDDSKREYLNRITKEIDRLNELLKSFFSFAKPQNLNLTSCCIKDIVNEIIPFLIKEIADKGIRFVEVYHPQLPKIRVDKNQMHQVFLNLFLNAIQAMPSGGELRIQATPLVSAGPDGNAQHFIRILISDTGKGIPANLINKVFDPFFTTKPKGIGLGLSIAYQIIKKHEGTIQVQSEWERGATFDIRLPETVESL